MGIKTITEEEYKAYKKQRREQIALACLQSVIIAEYKDGIMHIDDIKLAIEYADKFIEEIDK